MPHLARSLEVIAVAALLLLTQGCVATSAAPKRIALVVGNSGYRDVPKLRNPANGASAIGVVLARLGWQVTTRLDQTATGLRQSVDAFAKLLAGADAAVFFYAGHAIQLDGENFLMPIDGSLQDEADVRADLISLNEVLAKLAQARTSVVFLDACRNNPWVDAIKKQIEDSRSVSAGAGVGVSAVADGLAKVASQVGVLIAYASNFGEVASDGTGDHSPFTAGLLKHIEEPGLEVTDLLRKVRASVQEETGGKQLPRSDSGLVEALYFRARTVKRPPPP